MPIYLYTDPNGHEETITERMLYSTGRICAACGLDMWRKPQMTAVNWGGLRPSQGEYSTTMQQHFATVEQQRDEYFQRKELENG